jgi:hypothetical protein
MSLYRCQAESLSMCFWFIGWERVISVGTVDCSKKHNIELCRNYDVKGYPSLMVSMSQYLRCGTGRLWV